MTKQEKIIEAYGEYWKDYGHLTNENGFILQSKLFYPVTEMFKNGIDIQVICFAPKGNAEWRPKSLEGIEDNNGWIKIESVEDLPTKTIEYHVLRNGSLTTALYRGSDRWITPNNDYPKTTEIAEITHWQEITRPKPPIY